MLLRLATPGDPSRSVRAGLGILKRLSGRLQRSLTAREPAPDLAGSGHFLVLHLDQRTRSPSATGALRLLVGSGVESEEENEVAGQDDHAGKRSKLLAGAVAHVGHPGEVGVGEVGVRGKVDKAEVDDELDDLHDGDVFLPPDADAARGLKVVPVHDDVHRQVEHDRHPGDGRVAEELGVAEKGGRAVVVGVEEGLGAVRGTDKSVV